MRRAWTEKESELLVKLLKDGWSEEMIARALARTVEEVSEQLALLQIKPPAR